jgi:hypothetical protein
VLASLAADDGEKILSSWTNFCFAVLAHMEAEEMSLIAALLRISERDARVLLQEHRHVRTRLNELGAGFRLRTPRLQSLRSFADELRAHAKSEDRLLYLWADAHLDEPARASAAEALTATRTA